jgi:ElaB/YqjD/DUF883 family membrane-anchored ribosome-binding protein
MKASVNRPSTPRASRHGSKNGMASEVDSLKHGFAQLRADVVDLFSHAFGAGKSGAEAIGGSATDAMESLKGKVAELKKRGTNTVESIGDKIGEHPISSTIIAFGIGFILAKLLRRRD